MDYVGRAAGPAVAADLVRRIRSHGSLLAETPGEIGVVRPELADGLRSFPSPPFILFFRYAHGRVEIARILHERQDVERHDLSGESGG